MDDRFYTAIFPGEARVCGRILTSFSAYHYLLLKAIDSPFLNPSGENTPADLLAAICACRNSFGKEVDLKPRLRDAVWKVRMNRSPKLFREHCHIFARFMAEHTSGPKFWEVISGGQKTRDLTGPQILSLIMKIMMNITITEAEAWNMSLGRAQWLNAQIAELEGSERRFLWESDLVEPEATNA